MLCEIYMKKGYYIYHCENLFFDIGFSIGVDDQEVKTIVASCLKFGLFDKNQLKYNNVYTSFNIQERYYEVFKRARRNRMRTDYMYDEFLIRSGLKTVIQVLETAPEVKELPKGKEKEN